MCNQGSSCCWWIIIAIIILFLLCGNCGSCNNDFDKVDMTDAAKWMINCVAETHGRYGKGVVLNTLRGANMARLRELGFLAE